MDSTGGCHRDTAIWDGDPVTDLTLPKGTVEPTNVGMVIEDVISLSSALVVLRALVLSVVAASDEDKYVMVASIEDLKSDIRTVLLLEYYL